jgi:hypothetical protein
MGVVARAPRMHRESPKDARPLEAEVGRHGVYRCRCKRWFSDLGAHTYAVKDAYDDFLDVAKTIAKRAGLNLQ